MRNIPLFVLSHSVVMSAFAAPSADELLTAVPAECSDAAYLQFNATGDVGGEVYTKRTFSADRYVSKVLNSYGHPVPRVNGVLQGTGGQYKAAVLKTDFTPERDTIVLDLTKAYPCPELVSLVRTFVCERNGAITITDEVKFTKPCAFEDPLLTVGSFAPAKALPGAAGWETTVTNGQGSLALTLKASDRTAELFTARRGVVTVIL